MTRTLTRAARVETLRFTVATAVGMVRDLAGDDAFIRATREDPQRWEPLLDQLSAGMEEGGPGTLVAILGALSMALDG